MANIKALITQVGVDLSLYFKSILDTNFSNLAQKDYDNYNELKGFTDTHTNSFQAHTAEKITYNGSAGGTEVKTALNSLKADIDNVAAGGTEHDSLVTASLVDIEGTNYGAGGTGTYLDGRLTTWEQKQIAHQAETMQNDGLRFTLNNPYRYGGSLSLKGQMHCHTNNSDGLQTPLAVATAYKNAGYDFLAITDHDIITPDPVVAGLTFIQSCEESISHHIVAYDITERSGNLDVQTVLNYHRERSKATSIAHPNWANMYALTKDEMAKLYDYNFTEVFNNVVNGYGESQWDYALIARKKIFATAVDDCHDITGAKFNGGWVVVYTDINTKDAILDSLRKGNFYASTGNDVSISLSGNIITASSSALSTITFIGWNGKVLQTTSNVTSATYTIKGDEGYVRVRSIKTSDSKYAWSQPIFVEVVGGDEKIFTEAAKDNLENTDGFVSNLPAYVNSNVVQIATMESDEIWTSGAGTQSVDTTNVKVGTQSLKILENDNAGGSLYSKKNNIALDLSKFSDGSASVDTDYICFAFYVSDATKLVTPLKISFSQDALWSDTNSKYVELSVIGLITGWNFKKIAKSAFVTLGTGAWSGIQSMMVLWASAANALDAYISFDNVQMIRKDPEDDYPNPFQRVIDGVWVRDFAVHTGEWFVGYDSDKIVVRELSKINDRVGLLSAIGYTNFVSKSIFKAKSTTSYSHSIGVSGGNVIRAHWSGTSLGLDAYYNTIQEVIATKTVPSISAGDIVEFIISKDGSLVTLTAYKNFDYSNPYIVTGKTSLISKLCLGVQGQQDAAQDILSVSITPVKSAYHADIADISQRIAVKYKAGTFTVDDLNYGEVGIDTTNNRLYVKYSGAVKYAALT